MRTPWCSSGFLKTELADVKEPAPFGHRDSVPSFINFGSLQSLVTAVLSGSGWAYTLGAEPVMEPGVWILAAWQHGRTLFHAV